MKFTRPENSLIPDTIRLVEVDPSWKRVTEEGLAKRVKSPPLT